MDWNINRDACFSRSEVLLAHAARDLWNGSGGAPLGDLLRRLDQASFARERRRARAAS